MDPTMNIGGEGDLRQSEQRVRAAFPEYRSLLDSERIGAHLRARIEATSRSEHPFPHLVVTECFPARFSTLLAAAWPPQTLFRGDKHRRKLDLVPVVPGIEASDLRNLEYRRLPPILREIWNFFVVGVNREIVGPALAGIFAPEIDERIAVLRRAHAEGRLRYSMAGTVDWSYRANVGRFMMRGNGYVLKPHVDSAPYLVTVLHYFPERDADQQYGTTLYRTSEDIDLGHAIASGSTEYFDERTLLDPVHVPFRPNMLVAFANTARSAHGVVAPTVGYRKVFQYHLSLKGDAEKV